MVFISNQVCMSHSCDNMVYIFEKKQVHGCYEMFKMAQAELVHVLKYYIHVKLKRIFLCDNSVYVSNI